MRIVACAGLLLLLVLFVSAAADDQPANLSGRARALAPLIEEETFALIRIDFTRTDLGGLLETLPSQKDELADLVGRMKGFSSAFTKAGGTELVVSLSTEDLPGISFVFVPLKDKADVPALTGLLKKHLPEGTVVEKRGTALLAGRREVLDRLAKGKPAARADLPAAVKAAGDTALQVLLLLTADQRRVIDGVVTLPIQGVSSKGLSSGVRWAALGIDLGPKPRVEWTVQAANAAAARKLSAVISASVDLLGKTKLLGEDKPLKDLLGKDFDAAAKALEAKVIENRLTLKVSEPKAVRALAVVAGSILERTRGGEESIAQLKQISVALVRHHDATGTLPPHAIYSKGGKPLLSWRVAILPYLGEAALYKEFKLEEPWDSPHNKKLIDRMPRVYRSPKIKDSRPGLTTYLAPINKDFVFTGTKEGLRFPKDISDGTSNTAVLFDVNDQTGVLWTKPDDLVVDKKDSWKGLLGHYPAFVLVGLADCSALRLPKSAKAETIWALCTRAGGEVLPKLPR
jgi:hypothetical protein